MKTEQDIIPYNTTPLPDGPWLVFAPHPDDETFGMGGSMLLAGKAGIEIHIVIMTDGALGSAEQFDALVSQRKREAEAVAKAVNASSIIFLEQPDRGLKLSEPLIQTIADIVCSHEGASVFFPSMQEPHPDHRMTAELVWRSIQQPTPFSGQAFAYDISVQGQVNQYIDITSVIEEKRALMQLYPSQLAENQYIEVIEALDRARSYSLGNNTLAAEGFYRYEDLETDLITQLTSRVESLAVDGSISSEQKSEAIVKGLEEEIQKLREANHAIIHSTSWRVTKPLRRLKEMFSGRDPGK